MKISKKFLLLILSMLAVGHKADAQYDAWQPSQKAAAKHIPLTFKESNGVSEAPGPFQLFLAPAKDGGKDSNDGLSLQRPILTLNRAQEIIKNQPSNQDFEVRIAPGRYFCQQVDWRYTLPDYTITFKGDKDDRPVFDGCFADGTCIDDPSPMWFQLHGDGGCNKEGTENEPSNIHFEYIRVERYRRAIDIRGGRLNSIYGCYFKNIGNTFNKDVVYGSSSAVGLCNSDDNEIVNSHFVDIINTSSCWYREKDTVIRKKQCDTIIHAIYIAHNSDRNQIIGNRFKNGSGIAIKLRDYSNENLIERNDFTKFGIYKAVSDKGYPPDECPNWGNKVFNNRFDGDYNCNRLHAFLQEPKEVPKDCFPPFKGADRLRTSGNDLTESPCSLK